MKLHTSLSTNFCSGGALRLADLALKLIEHLISMNLYRLEVSNAISVWTARSILWLEYTAVYGRCTLVVRLLLDFCPCRKIFGSFLCQLPEFFVKIMELTRFSYFNVYGIRSE